MIFKIRHKTTGLYSSGGAYPRWTREGKAWATRAHLVNHLRLIEDKKHWAILLRRGAPDDPYADAEIVEYAEACVAPVAGFMEPKPEPKPCEDF